MLKKRMLALLLACGLALSACGGSEEPKESTEEVEDKQDQEEVVSEDNQTKDEIQFYNEYGVEEPTTLNSAKGSDNASYSILVNIMEPLVRSEGHGDSVEIAPAAAETWDISEDGLTYTFHLRDNKWSDGVDVTAQDYEFGIKTALDPETGAEGGGYMLSSIANADALINGEEGITRDDLGVKALDDKTLEITLEKPTSYFLYLLSQRASYPIRQDIFEEYDEKYGVEAEYIVSNGPFKLDNWVHQSELTLSKHEDYWDADTVSFETINWRIISDESTRLNAFANGELDQTSTNVKEWQERFDDNEDIKHETLVSNAVNYMFFNTKTKPYNNAKVRRAISLAMDRQETIDAVFNGVGEPAYGWVVPPIQVEGTSYRDLVEGPLKEFMDKEDPKELFREGLAEEGFDAEDFELNIQLGGTSDRFVEIGDYYINALERGLDVPVSVKTNEWSAYITMLQNDEIGFGYMAWGAEYNDPSSMMNLLLSDNDALSTRWSNEEYDRLVKEANDSLDTDEKVKLFGEAEKILMEESPIIPLFVGEDNVYTYKYYKDYTILPFTNPSLKYGYTAGR